MPIVSFGAPSGRLSARQRSSSISPRQPVLNLNNLRLCALWFLLVGMVTAPLLSLFVIPTAYVLMRWPKKRDRPDSESS